MMRWSSLHHPTTAMTSELSTRSFYSDPPLIRTPPRLVCIVHHRSRRPRRSSILLCNACPSSWALSRKWVIVYTKGTIYINSSTFVVLQRERFAKGLRCPDGQSFVDAGPFGCLLQSCRLYKQPQSAAMHWYRGSLDTHVTLSVSHQTGPHWDGESAVAAE